MLSADFVIATAVGYVGLLFLIAYVGDRRASTGSGGLLRSPFVYTLAISVYCTSWTFYGAVGSAARNGLEYLAIYLGPTLVFVGWWFVLRKLVRISHNQRLTSVADLLSSRFGKSSRLAVLVTVIAVIGLVLGFLTLGLGWLALPIIIPLAILGYYVVTLGSPARATVGMRVMDLVLTPTRGAPLDGWKILVHPLVFWITVWIAWPISLIVALLTPRREMVQDLISGTLMLRRSPMAAHWRRHGGGPSRA